MAVVVWQKHLNQPPTWDRRRYRGGPMHYADTLGLPVVKQTLEAMDIAPAQLLLDCIAAGTSLAKYWSKHGGAAWAAAKGQTHPSRMQKGGGTLTSKI